jgi:putative transcriptional regulator
LNRPSQVAVDGLLDSWAPWVTEPAVLFSGGPVEPEGALGVARLAVGAHEPPGWRRMFGRTGLVDLDVPVIDGFDTVRIYAGYAGWGAGQLQGEVAEGSWFVAPAEPDDLCATDSDALWRRVLRRQPEPLRMMITMPVDPAVN